MGKFQNGILGGFNGKVGNVVEATWKGITYMKAVANTSNKKATEKQMIQRAKFSFAARFLQTLYPVIQLGFKTQGVKKSPQNAALSHLLNFATLGEYPDFEVDFENLYLSKGSLKVADTPSVALSEGIINFSWTDSENTLKLMANQQVILVGIANGYYPSYSIDEYVRSNQSGSIPVPLAPVGTEVHCYLAFAETGVTSKASNSIYLGTVTIE